MVTDSKQVFTRACPSPTLGDDIDDFWSEMNQDFALDSGHNEEYYTPKETTAVIKSLTTVHKAAPVLADVDWVAMNRDFACDASHDMEGVERISKPRSSAPSLQEPYGDYGVWWE
jgi:hypothetical protein